MSAFNKSTVVLGIESTAHTFSSSVVECNKPIHGNILSDIRRIYKPSEGSGIHPREASRHHADNAAQTVRESLDQANVHANELDAIAFSAGPGLGPCLRVGAMVARTLASYYSKPLIPVNHAVGHIELASMLTGANDPIVLLVSGGHTLTAAHSSGRWRVFGETLDITIGQLIDQFGRETGLSSPCGPEVEKLAQKSSNYVQLPYTVKGNDVSLSGVLTAAKRLLRSQNMIEDLASSIQETGFAMLTEVVERSLAFLDKNEILLTGGVAANSRLQQMLEEMCAPRDVTLLTIPLKFSGDCGAQIAWTGLLAYKAGVNVALDDSAVRQSWRIDQVDTKWRS